MTTIALFAILFLCLAMGLPISLSLGFSSITTILLFSNDSLASIALKYFATLSEHYTLLAIPFFILSSVFLTTGGVANRIIRFVITSYSIHYTKLYEMAQERIKADKTVREAQAALDAIDVRLSYKSILSPITGIVSQVTAQEGETVVSGFV